MTRRDLTLHLLKEAGDRGITTGELLQAGVGSRYSARIMELRQAGYVITSERVRDGSWRYRLVGDARPDKHEDRPTDTNLTKLTGDPTKSSVDGKTGNGRLFGLEPTPHWREDDAA